MTYVLALIGTADSTIDDVDNVVGYHLAHPAFWTGAQHRSWAKGTRIVAKVAGAKVLVLTGRIDCLAPADDPMRDGDREWRWRYDVVWDDRPARTVPASELGAPFVTVRAARTIKGPDFERAQQALYG